MKTSDKIRLHDFIEFAIVNEQEAAGLYEKYADVCISRVQKELLERMAIMERNHEKILKNFSKGVVGSFSTRHDPTDLKITDFMVPVVLTQNSTLQDVFIFAIKAEKKAAELYETLANLEEEPKAKALLENLSCEEKIHKHDLEAEFEKTFISEN